ncbi:MAG: septum formation inhibitor Maf, partial [Nitrospirae bacterium CG_4_10_14_3_um_filter_53_41]
MKRLILASASPRRRDLLAEVGLRFEVIPSSVEEEHQDGLSPLEVARTLAGEKAADVASRLTSGIVIGADTIVVLDGEILGKPKDPEDAFQMLRRLSGRSHEVITALVLIEAESGKMMTGQETTRVFFKEMTDREISAYISTGEPMDKAGAYGIQGKGMLLVRRIQGCYTNVVGLP